MSNLYIFGDSYAASKDNNEKCWPNLLANLLDSNLINHSISGASQDWMWLQMQKVVRDITQDDSIVVVLTNPARFWFIEDQPSITKIRPRDFPDIPREYQDDIRSFMMYIQRPILDTIWLENRLGWLAYNAHLRKWRKPIVLLAFEQDFSIAKSYNDIVISNGNLFENVSVIENNDITNNIENYLNTIGNVDPRYNHMCLSNHPILANKLYDTIINNKVLN